MVGVDTIVLYDGNFFPAYWRDLKKVKNPDGVVVVFDHRVRHRTEPAPRRTRSAAPSSNSLTSSVFTTSVMTRASHM